MYRIDAPKKFIRERMTEIERPDWWPTEEEVEQSLKPEAALRSGKANGVRRAANRS
jgi:hypothetical protein